MSKGDLCLLLITRDEADRAAGLLEELHGVADEVVVVDSSGETHHKKLMEKLGGFDHTHVLRLPPLGFAEPYRWYALGKVCSEWVLMLDSDERINGELRADIKKIVANTAAAGLRILREPLLCSTEGCVSIGRGAPKARLFRKSATRFFGYIHEQPTIVGVVETLPAKYRMMHYIDKQTYWWKSRKYTKLAVFLKRWQYGDFVSSSATKRLSLKTYLAIRGKKPWEEVSTKELLLFKRLGSAGLKKKLAYRPNESLRRTLLFMDTMSGELRKLSFEVWLDIRLAGGATPYLGLDREETWEKIAAKQASSGLPAEDFFISLLIEQFYGRNPTYQPKLPIARVIEELNCVADRVFPETARGDRSHTAHPQQ